MAYYTRLPTRQPSSPVMVVHLEGWVDAGLGGATAMASLLEAGPADPVAVWDSEELIDMRARRPIVRIVDGVNSGLTWQEIKLVLGTDRAANDLLMLVGPEPDVRWRTFAGEVVGLATELGVRMVVGLGAFPAPVPHTRPVKLASTATHDELAMRMGFVAGTIEVPAGVNALLEDAFRPTGIPAIGLWARVPHYVAGLPFPAAASALVGGLATVAGLSLDTAELDAAADAALQRVEALIANSAEHQAMVRQLETTVDSAEGNPLHLGEIPSGEEIAAELQRFLRGDPPAGG